VWMGCIRGRGLGRGSGTAGPGGWFDGPNWTGGDGGRDSVRSMNGEVDRRDSGSGEDKRCERWRLLCGLSS